MIKQGLKYIFLQFLENGKFHSKQLFGRYKTTLTIIKDPNRRRVLSKFRTSNHKLEIEFGRYRNIPREERICKHCDKQVVEDEFHFAFECDKYDIVRQNSHSILLNYFQLEITNDLRRKLLSDALSSNDPVITDLFSQHVSKCFYIRDNCPQSRTDTSYTFYLYILMYESTLLQNSRLFLN